MTKIPCAIGLDVGGTKIAGGVVATNTGEILARRVTPTLAERGGQAVLDDTVALTHELCLTAEEQGWSITGIGVGVPELVDPQGAITSAYNFDWRHLPVRAALEQFAPTIIDADVRVGALAEAKFGAGVGYDLFCYITIGTGISYCLMQNGRPYLGARGNALMLASSPLTTQCTNCGTTLRPVLEEFASGPGLVASYRAVQGTTVTRGEDVLAAVQAGDAQAAAIVRHAGEAVGVSLGWLVNVLDPEALVIGGGLGTAPGLYWASLVTATRAHIWSDINRELPIVQAALGPDSGIIGAAALV